MLQQGHLAKHNVVSLPRELVLDGAVFGSPQQELLDQLVQLCLPAPALHISQ